MVVITAAIDTQDDRLEIEIQDAKAFYQGAIAADIAATVQAWLGWSGRRALSAVGRVGRVRVELRAG